jgi:hypothetical protein
MNLTFHYPLTRTDFGRRFFRFTRSGTGKACWCWQAVAQEKLFRLILV